MSHRKRTLLPIGIHLNAEAVNMVQLEQTEAGIGVVSKASWQSAPAVPETAGSSSDIRLPGAKPAEATEASYEEALQFVRRKITSNGFRGCEAVINLPMDQLMIQHVRLAPTQPDELEAGLAAELQGKLPFDTREAVIRHIVAGTVSENNETKQDVIALAARRSVVEQQVASASRLGLRVVGVGAEPCAMCYPYTFAASHAAPTADGPPVLMIVFLGPRRTHVAIVRGQDMTFVKGVELGTNHLIEAIAEVRGIRPDEVVAMRAKWRESSGAASLQEAVEVYNGIRYNLEHIVDEIESCMRYHASLARGAHIDRVLFLGPEARDRALVQILGAHLGIPCEVGNPLAVVLETDVQCEAEPEMAAAIGLSLFTAQ